MTVREATGIQRGDVVEISVRRIEVETESEG